MSQAALGALHEQRRTALLGYYLGQIAPGLAKLPAGAVGNAQDLYSYQLIDPLVTAAVDGSRVSSAVASVQQYLHGIYGGLEPGHKNGRPVEEQNDWRERLCEYATWAGYQKLVDYPENYIEPGLRLRRSASYDTLITELSQSRISDTAVQKAMMSYLQRVEAVSNLNILAGYIDTFVDDEAVLLQNADYYFVARDNGNTAGYYWRKVKVKIDGTSTHINPAGWSEWLPITSIPPGAWRFVRPAVMNGRLYVAWVESRTTEAADDVVQRSYDLKLSYLGMDGQWSVPASYALQQDRTAAENAKDMLHIAWVEIDGKRRLLVNHFLANAESDVSWQFDEWMVGERIEASTVLAPVRVKMKSVFEDAERLMHHFKAEAAMKEYRPEIQRIDEGVYLALGRGKVSKLSHLRLNTVVTSRLVQAACVSIDEVLGWSTQNAVEPAYPDHPEVPVTIDFHGAYSLYFWEIFFHVPFAIAWRLHEEFDPAAAERWLHYLFNPQLRERPADPPINFPYWACRPLVQADGTAPSREPGAPLDPDAIAYAMPSYYRKCVFQFYVKNLMSWGDQLYRRQTRESLNEAKLHYMRAMALLGPRPNARLIGRWDDPTLETLVTDGSEELMAFEAQQPVALDLPGDCPRPWAGVLAQAALRTPVNSRLLEIWRELDSRLYNLRHNLSIDGKALQLALFEPPANPKDLLRAQLAAKGGAQRGIGGRIPVPPFRFRALLPRVQQALDTLIGFGDRVLYYREAKERVELELLLQGQAMELMDFSVQVQQLAVEQAGKALEVTQASSAVVAARQAYFDRLVEEDVSDTEKDWADSRRRAINLHHGATGTEAAGAAADMAPNMFGMISFGGMQWGAPFHGTAQGLIYEATVALLEGEMLMVGEDQRRRREEWIFQAGQAKAEQQVLAAQLEHRQQQKAVAEKELEQRELQREQARQMLAWLQARSTSVGLYSWLLGQLSSFYFQAYDAVLGLCLNLERTWQFELGDEDTRFIQPDVWFDSQFGLAAGEALRLQVLRMESSWLRRHERRLVLNKTVSLRRTLGDAGWAALYKALAQGSGTFSLDARLFDEDYPGHYLRQLVQVSVTLPGIVGAYEDVRAVLTQVSSRTLLKPDTTAVGWFYDPEPSVAPAAVLSNVRAGQSIGLSSGLDDNGQFSLDPHDERYLPFEGTGAISTWELYLPMSTEDPRQQAFIEQMDDVVLHLWYQAVDGGPVLREKVEEQLDGKRRKRA